MLDDATYDSLFIAPLFPISGMASDLYLTFFSQRKRELRPLC
jgi:hypothetical protein